MYGRFDYYGIPDIDREMALEEAETRYELVYSTGGHGGPYKGEKAAKEAATRLLKGGKDRWIGIIDAKYTNDLMRAKASWILDRKTGWEKGPRPLPFAPARLHFKESVGLEEARSTPVKGKKGKYKYKGKVGVWRTLGSGDRVFFPDDKSGPMAMRKPTRSAAKKGPGKARARRGAAPEDPDLKQLRPGKTPDTITLYGGGKAKVEKKVWDASLKAAKKDKEEAEKHKYAKNPDEWPASDMSIKWLKDTLAKSPEEIALKSYKYLHHRAHAEAQTSWGKMPVDPAARRDWEKFTGKKITSKESIRVEGRELEIEAEIERLESTGSPFPEVRERRIQELRAELDEAKKVPPGVLGQLQGSGMRRGKPEGGRGMGPGKGKGPHRGTGEGSGTGACACEGLRAQVDEAVAKGKHRPRKWLHLKASMFKGEPGKGQSEGAVAAGDLLTERKQALLTGAIRKKLPPIYSQENEKDPMVWLKLFSPYMAKGYWLITEFDGEDTMFGAANTGMGWELGYMSLSEMENTKHRGVQAVERDMYFKPTRLSKAKADISRSRGEN